VITAKLVKLDWLSFTFPITLLGENDNEYTLSHVLSAFHDHTGQALLGCVTKTLWEWKATSGFYSHRIQCPDSLISISWRGGNPHALCEISGRSIDLVLQSISVATLAQATSGRATRLDIAVDFETELMPQAFIEAGFSERIKSTASVDTETGSTRYIGSRSGERMARIYRYHPPHPRSQFLRVEIELKGDAAKITCAALHKAELTEVAMSANLSFAWKHPLWTDTSIEVSKLPARFYDRDGAETLRWLETAVVPSLRSADENGLIDLKEWLSKHFPHLFR